MQFSRPKQSYRGPQRYQMAYQHANHMAAASTKGGTSVARGGQDGSVAGYIPDDSSSVHSSALGGSIGGNAGAYPAMFQGFQETWPQLQGGPQSQIGGHGPIGSGHARGAPEHRAPESIAGESVAASEVTDITNGSTRNGQGGVSLRGLSISDLNRQASLSQSDKLRRYVEGQGGMHSAFGLTGSGLGGRSNGMHSSIQPPIGSGRGATINKSSLEQDEDARSVSTAFASQVGGTGGYD